MHGQSLALAILVALCLAPGRSQSQDAPAWREIRYRESVRAFSNPERGFYAPRMSHRIGRLDGLRQRGITLVLAEGDRRRTQAARRRRATNPGLRLGAC